MNATNQAFFVLLKAGLWNREPEHDCFPLSPEEWKQVYLLAQKQTVDGIILDGILRLPQRFFPPRELLLQWMVRINAIENKNKQMDIVTTELYQLFTKNNLHIYLIKGQGVAACYPAPSHRMSGDIDWYFPDKHQFDSACDLIQSNGLSVGKQAKFSKYYIWRGFLIEHHRRLLDLDNPLISHYVHKLIQQEDENSIYLQLNEMSVRMPSPLLTHVLVNAHILKHLLTSGIGVRQLCDSARVCYTYRHSIEADKLQQVYRKTGIYHWIQLVNNLLVNYLGMSEDCLPFPLDRKPQEAERLIMDIMTSGNFGHYGGPLTASTDSPHTKQNMFRRWLERCIRYFRYVRYAPLEASWNPVVVVYSHIRNLFIR